MAAFFFASLRQALGVIVVGAVAVLAVAQQHIRRLQCGIQSDHLCGDDGHVPDQGEEEEVAGSNGGLVGLSLTYALPIVGEPNKAGAVNELSMNVAERRE